MVSPVHTALANATLTEARDQLLQHNISSLPVLDGGELVGVLSRSDLLRVGRRHAGARGRAALLTLPNRPVVEHMTQNVITVPVETPASEAARLMVQHGIHRVFTTRAGELAGVFSTRDIMVSVRDKKAKAPICESASTPIFTVKAEEPISLATERLEKARISGLLVVEDGWPVGVFTQAEALQSRDLERNTPVDEIMNPALVCLPEDTRMHRAAGHAIAMRVRRVVAVKQREAVGILTGLDFARFAAQ